MQIVSKSQFHRASFQGAVAGKIFLWKRGIMRIKYKVKMANLYIVL